MFEDRCYDRDNNFNANFVGDNMNVDMDVAMNDNMNNGQVIQSNEMVAPVSSPVRERCVHKTIIHDVPHVCPIHTRIINHHVFRHTYRPQYTCSEENVCSNVECGSCNQFQ